MELRDSRRLTGANILWEHPGAVIDASLPEEGKAEVLEAWRAEARRILDAVGWEREGTAMRVFPGGASLAISAPLDALYAATEVNEWAWEAAVLRAGGAAPPDLAVAARRLRTIIEEEANPGLLAVRAAALERGVAFVVDDDIVSVGLGKGSRSWPARELPPPADIDWAGVHDVPVAMVTGTNGKTTTVRLLAAIVEAAGKLPGISSTDRVCVGEEVVERGDWSGPGGARLVVRDPRVDVAILETARGGMLRRGLALERTDVACVLNVAEDHLGEWGVADTAALAEGKFIVTSVAACAVLNADDEIVVAHADLPGREILWFSLDPASPVVEEHLGRGGSAAVSDGEAILWCAGDSRQPLMRIDEIPCTLGGAARHNVANSLAAVAIAHGLGLGVEATCAGLRSFASTPAANPGRLNEFELGGVRVLVDFAHNPHGYRALFEMVKDLPAERRLVLLGQAGDRSDEAIRELARITWRAGPDRIVIKELTGILRGRELGEVPALLQAELEAAGAPAGAWKHAPSELAAVRHALGWAQPGDLLVLLIHECREEALALVESLQASGWRPGRAIEGP